MKQFQNYISNFFKGHERSVKAKKNIIYSFFLKGISIIVGLIFVPLILGYLDAERYGIWLTLSSILAWFSFFDIGLGNGLRNRFAEAIAIKKYELAKTYVSTTYAILGIALLVVLILFNLINPLLNWQKILNTTAVESAELSIIALIVFIFFLLSFFFNLIGTILMADQKPAINNSFGLIANIIALIVVFILTKTTKGSLISLSIVMSIAPVLVLIIATFYFFNKDYKKYKPNIKYVDFSKSRDLLSLGLKFFYFQIAAIVFYSTANFLIAQYSNQEAVAAYNIVYKYLFIAVMLQSIIVNPFWSAVTEAYSRKDFKWLKKTINKLNYVSVIIIILILILLIFSPFVYNVWIGNKIIIPFDLSLSVTIYLILTIILTPFSQFINGLGKLKLSLYSISLNLSIFIPIAIFLGNNYGSTGIVAAMSVVQLFTLLIMPLQVYKIINQKAKGIWNK